MENSNVQMTHHLKPPSKCELNYQHDWSVSGSLECIKAYLQARNLDCDGIHFKGEGWYQGDGDTLLIVCEGEQWRLFGWSGRDPRSTFQGMLTLENHDV